MCSRFLLKFCEAPCAREWYTFNQNQTHQLRLYLLTNYLWKQFAIAAALTTVSRPVGVK